MTPAPASSQTTARAGCNSDHRIFTVPNAHYLHLLPGAGVCFGSAPAPVRDSGCGSIPQPVTLHLHLLPGAGVCLGSAPASVRDSVGRDTLLSTLFLFSARVRLHAASGAFCTLRCQKLCLPNGLKRVRIGNDL